MSRATLQCGEHLQSGKMMLKKKPNYYKTVKLGEPLGHCQNHTRALDIINGQEEFGKLP